jgi:hypothetical protein
MTFLVVVEKTADNKISKFQEYPTRAEADSHIIRVAGKYPNAFVVDNYTLNSFEHTTVDIIAKTITYDSAAFETDKTMSDWKYKMAMTDGGMPRYLEDHIKDDHDGVASNEFLQGKYDDKKALRATRP